MYPFIKSTEKKSSIPVLSIFIPKFDTWLKSQDAILQRWVKTTQFSAESGSVCLVPDTSGGIQFALLGVKDTDDFWAFGALPVKLPKGIYHLEKSDALKSPDQLQRACLAFALGHYQFSTYKKNTPREVQ